MKPYYTERLGDSQVVDLLRLALSTGSPGDAPTSMLKSLIEMQSSELLTAAREQMSEHGLGTAEAASLLGVSELTVRRWFEIAEDVPPAAKRKLAGLCFLLSRASEMPRDSAIGQRIRLAIAIAKGESCAQGPDAGDERDQLVASVFDAAGVAATALHAVLEAEFTLTERSEEERIGEAEDAAEQP